MAANDASKGAEEGEDGTNKLENRGFHENAGGAKKLNKDSIRKIPTDFIHETIISAKVFYQTVILEWILRQKPLPPSKDGRHIPLRTANHHQLVDERRGHSYISNAIRSSRYTIYDFLPKQIIFQATRLSNFYFICIGIPQAIPGLSTTGNYTTILPLIFFILLTILKEGYDDYRRHRLDKVENRRLAKIISPTPSVHIRQRWTSQIRKLISSYHSKLEARTTTPPEDTDQSLWHETQWRDIRVGDIVLLNRDDPVPADMVLLYSSGEHGIAYIETMALDGETNLKTRQAPPELNHCCEASGIDASDVEFVVEDPNPDLYSFHGRFRKSSETFPLTLNNVLFRGSVLRNTDFVTGCVLNTGEECKIRMNANHHPKAKIPHLESLANRIVLSLVVYVIALSLGCTAGYILWKRHSERYAWYLSGASVKFKETLIGFAIQFNNIIPLALYVSLEIVKVGQMLMINSDVEMYDSQSDTPMRCNTNTILENLGQVNYVLTDKTGTLTENVMRFRKMTAGGVAWRHGGAGDQGDGCDTTAVLLEKGAQKTAEGEMRKSVALSRSSAQLRRTERNTEELAMVDRGDAQAETARKLVLAMALCHDCLPEKVHSELTWQGSSQDELAMVRAAKELGLAVVKRNSQAITLLVTDGDGDEREEIYEILDVIEFSSLRKRMSVVVRTPEGRIWLICKGADSVIFSRLAQADLAMGKAEEVRDSIDAERRLQRVRELNEPRNSFGGRPSLTIHRDGATSLDIERRPRVSRSLSRRLLHAESTRASTAVPPDSEVYTVTFRDLERFATEGLRTLVFAARILPESEYVAWKRIYNDASSALTNRQERIESAAEGIEQALQLLGATAIEDKLQEGVPDTIDKLRRANIRVWMLTGDKRETAINIAHSAGICLPNSDIYTLDAKEKDLDGQIQLIQEGIHSMPVHRVAVLDGHTLSEIDKTTHLQDRFYTLLPLLDSVICCRASPRQKADIVKAIKSRIAGSLTLAIGDGANDIAMIQASHVGIGLSGKEGLQAARVADYSIAQFRFLQRLLFVHGRWSYVRTARFILMTFWKEMFFYTMQFLYQRYNGYTGTSLYEMWSLTVLNTLFTSLCVIIMGVFEQDLHADTLLAVPELYVHGQRNGALNVTKYVGWMVAAVVEGLIVWYVSWAAYGRSNVVDQGIFALGDLSFSLGIMWTNWKLFILETHYKSIIVAISFLVTVGGWWAWNGFLSGIYPEAPSPYYVRGGFAHTFGKDPVWWLTLVAIMMVLVLAEMGYKLLKRQLVLSGAWPPWRRRKRQDANNVEEWSVELWQEIENTPEFQEHIASGHGTFNPSLSVSSIHVHQTT